MIIRYSFFIVLLLVTAIGFGQQLPSLQAKSKNAQPEKLKTASSKVKKVNQPHAMSAATVGAEIKIITNADAQVYVDGEFQSNIKAGPAFKLHLRKGIYQVKIVSARYGDIQIIKDGYVVESNDQQDYWNFDLKTQEEGRIVDVIKKCMMTQYTGETLDGFSINIQTQLFISNGTITFVQRWKQYQKDHTLFADNRETSNMPVSAITGYHIFTGTEKDKIFGGTLYYVVLEGTSSKDEENIYEGKPRSQLVNVDGMRIGVNQYCLDELEGKLKKIFKAD